MKQSAINANNKCKQILSLRRWKSLRIVSHSTFNSSCIYYGSIYWCRHGSNNILCCFGFFIIFHKKWRQNRFEILLLCLCQTLWGQTLWGQTLWCQVWNQGWGEVRVMSRVRTRVRVRQRMTALSFHYIDIILFKKMLISNNQQYNAKMS